MRMGILEEQDGVVLGAPPGLASVVHQMNTSSSNCHTPVADMIKGACLDMFYLMDVLPHSCMY